MSNIMHPDEYRARTVEARRRLAELLQPRTEQENRLVTWLGDSLDLQWLLCLVEMIEYRQDR